MAIETLDLILWILAGLGIGAALGPPLLAMVGLTRLSYHADDNPAAVRPPVGDADYERSFEELRTLGFEPVGTITEQGFFFTHHWWKIFRTRCMATSDRRCFATLYRLDPFEPLRLSFETLTTGGGMVRTVMPGAGMPRRFENYLRIEIQGASISELLSRHTEHVGQFSKETGNATISATLQERATIDEENDGRLLQEGSDRWLHLVLPVLFIGVPTLFICVCLPLLLGETPAARLWAVSLGLSCLGYLAFVQWRLPQVLRQDFINAHFPRKPE